MDPQPHDPDIGTPAANAPALRARAREAFVMTAATSMGQRTGPLLEWLVKWAVRSGVLFAGAKLSGLVSAVERMLT